MFAAPGMYIDFVMMGFLSLPDEIVELVGEQVINRHGVKAWCRVASTCTRLWGMQLPDSADSWAIEPDVDIEGESKVSILLRAQHLRQTQIYEACAVRRRTLATAADTGNALIVLLGQ